METNYRTADDVRDDIQRATELVIDDSGDVISRDEFHHRLEAQYDAVIVQEGDTTHYRDPRMEEEQPGEDYSSIYTEIPMTLCQQAVTEQKHPEEIIDDPDAYADRMNAFSDAVSQEFERQLEEQDDPFPLTLSPDDE